MDKAYDHKKIEEKIYGMWDEGNYFAPIINHAKKPFTIILPPPNASGKMHTGNVLMIALEDLLVRWHRMKGEPTLWLPGTDHAGTETQITFEKELSKQGQSRFDLTRQQLYEKIWDFVQKNKNLIEAQIKKMGASVDWTRYTFTLDETVIQTVHNTFKKMAKDNLVYRGNYMVNYCPKCGTTYADVELKHEERTDPLYYMKYGPFIVATVRPETKFGDSAVAVNPKDKRYKKWVGEEIEVEGLNGKFKLKVIEDNFVDPKFGTGVVKVTPAHDKNDYEAGLRHNLKIIPVIDLNGKLNAKTGKYAGLSIFGARKKVVEDLKQKGFMDHVDEKYLHTVALCKAGHEIEPMIIPNWFIRVDYPKKSFKKPALEAVKNETVKIYPKWRKITYIRWMEEMRDWPISRQNVWGIQIPIWYEINDPKDFMVWFLDKDKKYNQGVLQEFLDKNITLDEIKKGIQRVIANPNANWVFEDEKKENKNYLPETDTFDTWFSSGQWPLVTLGFPDSEDFNYFYPTTVLETGWEIIRLWVSRMIMFGIYLTGKPPFKHVYLHGIIKALDGRKMSKSLGNVINPEEYIEEYGVDALRMGLISGSANGKDFNFPKDKVLAYKHFANKIWNMARFILGMKDEYGKEIPALSEKIKKRLKKEDKEILKLLKTLTKKVEIKLESFRFADAGELIYQFMWHTLADKYLESVKNRDDKDVALACLIDVYSTCLKLLHPFMPFITEEINQILHKNSKPLIISSWPYENKNSQAV